MDQLARRKRRRPRPSRAARPPSRRRSIRAAPRAAATRPSSCRGGLGLDVLLEPVGVVARRGRRRRRRARAPSRSWCARGAGGARSRAGPRPPAEGPRPPHGRERGEELVRRHLRDVLRFIQRSFSGSKTDGDAPTRSSENSRSISSRVRISRSPPGAQPRRARKLKSASGRMPCVAPLLDGRGAVALGELLAVGAEDHAEVGELRDRRAERPEERDVLGRVGEVVVAADDVA